MENGPLIRDFPIKTSVHRGFSIAMFDNQRVDSKWHESQDKSTSPRGTHGMWTALRLEPKHLTLCATHKLKKYNETLKPMKIRLRKYALYCLLNSLGQSLFGLLNTLIQGSHSFVMSSQHEPHGAFSRAGGHPCWIIWVICHTKTGLDLAPDHLISSVFIPNPCFASLPNTAGYIN